jgi:Leucine-rich repeat (LRR) protein
MRNGIQKLETNCIADLPSLSLLNLNGNNIQYVSSDALRNLASSWNPLKLSLSRNNLTVLPAKFVDMPYLERLSVKQSKIKRIHPLAFSMTPRLLSIDLSYNSLTEFHNGTFNLSRDLPIELFLDANMLETISGGSFQKGMTIRHLSIIGNNLRHVDPNLFTTAKILNFDASLNHLTSLPRALASPYQNYMMTFKAISNQITSIPAGAFNGKKSLLSINLMGNVVTTIEPGAFQALGSLQQLNLIGNPLTTVPSDVFQNLDGPSIYLHCNQLSPFPVITKNVTV